MTSHAIVTKLADVVPEDVHWLWDGRIPLGKLTLIDGDPGLGKTSLMLDIAARVTRGIRMPGSAAVVHGGVLLLTAEDGLADTIRPRFDAAGGDAEWLMSWDGVGDDADDEDEDDIGQLPTFPDHVEMLRELVKTTYTKLVIIDPIMAFLNNAVDSHKDHHVRRALAPLARVAADTGAAVVMVRHLTKSPGGLALYRGNGSIGFTAQARSALLVAVDPADPTLRVLAPMKYNLTAEPTALSFRIVERGRSSAIEWLGKSAHTANALVQPPENRSEADRFLAELLADGPLDRAEVLAQMEANGFSKATMDRAANRINVRRRQQGAGKDKCSIWSLSNPLAAHGADPGAAIDPIEANANGAVPNPLNRINPLNPLTRRSPEADEANGVIITPDGGQALTDERIAELREQRRRRREAVTVVGDP